MKRKLTKTIAVLLSLLLPFLFGSLAAAGEKRDITIDQTVLSRLEAGEEEGAQAAASAVYAAESSRQKRIGESISQEIAESLSVEDSIAESVRYSLWVVASLEQSAADSLAYELSVAASLEESRAESVAESIRHSQAEEAIAQMLSEKQQIRESRAEAARQASVAASIAEAERQAAEAAARAAEASRAAAEAEASRAAAAAEASRAAAAAEVSRAAASGGTTVIIGDSRASGFGIYGAWPAEYVFYTYSPVRQSDGMADSAAAYRPARVVFCNGLDDLVSYSASSAASRYEDYIRYFHSLSPSTQICVCAVLPVLQTALDKRPQLSSIGEFNGLLRSMCSRNGWIYLDASSGISPSCYYGDGIHFTPSWTRQWMSNIRSALGF